VGNTNQLSCEENTSSLGKGKKYLARKGKNAFASSSLTSRARSGWTKQTSRDKEKKMNAAATMSPRSVASAAAVRGTRGRRVPGGRELPMTWSRHSQAPNCTSFPRNLLKHRHGHGVSGQPRRRRSGARLSATGYGSDSNIVTYKRRQGAHSRAAPVGLLTIFIGNWEKKKEVPTAPFCQ
jgi:hypothetical protein